MATSIAVAFIFGLFALLIGVYAYVIRQRQIQYERVDFIRSYPWPPGLLRSLKKHHPYFMRKEEALVAQGLRQFFLAYLRSGKKYVAMPSQVVDDLWHEFILYTRSYDEFCQKAFGQFLHHTPAMALSTMQRQSNEGLRRVWWWACKDENINPVNPTRLPLLFALDKKLNIKKGFFYTADCEQLRKNGVPGTQCGGDFASSDVDGSTTGMGSDGGGVPASWSETSSSFEGAGADASSSSSSSGGDGGGDGGGCGGGCGS